MAPETSILLLSTDETPFADYLAEILCTEGFPWFDRVGSWSDVGGYMGKAEVLLAPPGASDRSSIQEWLDAGGSVIAMKPTPDVAELAGLKGPSRTASELPLDIGSPFDCRFGRAHGDVDLYAVAGEAITYASVIHEGERFPATLATEHGRGKLAVFTYDLPRSIALTRQGNPEWSGCRGTDMGSDTFRPADLFVRGCGEQTWLDFASAATPFADVQQRLLAHLILSFARRPIPRLWYLPHAKPAAITVLGDSDQADPEVVSAIFDAIAAAGGTMSAFLIDYTVDNTERPTVEQWRTAGHEVSVHPDYGLHGDKSRPNRETMTLTEKTLIDRFESRFGFRPRTVRNHSISWVPFAIQPEVERSLGIRLNSSYCYSCAFGEPRYGGPPMGYVNGSGQPQKFADEHGRVLDIYQLGAHVCDEMLKPQYLDLNAEKAWPATKELIDASLTRWHSNLGLSFHPITYYDNPEAKRWLRDYIVPYAVERNLPIWSSEKVLDFAEARRACRVASFEWDSGRLQADIRVPSGAQGLTLLLPSECGGLRLDTLTSAGSNVESADLRLVESQWRPVVLKQDQSEVVAQYA